MGGNGKSNSIDVRANMAAEKVPVNREPLKCTDKIELDYTLKKKIKICTPNVGLELQLRDQHSPALLTEPARQIIL